MESRRCRLAVVQTSPEDGGGKGIKENERIDHNDDTSSSSDDDDDILHYQPFHVKRRSEAIQRKKAKLFNSARKAAEKGPVIERLKSIPTGKVGHQYYPTLEVIKVVWLGAWKTEDTFKVLLTDGEQNVEMCFHPDHAKRLSGLFLKKKKKLVPGARIKLENYYMREEQDAEHKRMIVVSRLRTMRKRKDLTKDM
jgi:hypothetical protein